MALATACACGSTVPLTDNTATGAASGQAGDGGLSSDSEEFSNALGDQLLPGQGPTASGGPQPAGSVGTSPTGGSPGRSAPSIADGPSGAATVPSPGSIPEKGRGWDSKFVYVGVVTNQDIQQVATTIGVDGLDSGDQKADAESVIAYLNDRGGLYGRQLKGIYLDVKSTNNGDANGQATCTFFTQDNPVIAVLNRVLQNDTPSFRACMAKAGTMVLAGGTQALDDKVLAEQAGWYVHLTVPSWNPLAPVFAERLRAQGYFQSWDTREGAAGVAPVKVGILAEDKIEARGAVAALSRALAGVGHAPADTVYYADQQSLQAAVLRFRSAGITHVMNTDPFVFLFMQNAESQQYRPRYAVNTLNGPVLLLQDTVPPRQLNGTLGLGWAPTFDVDAGHDASDTAIPGRKECSDVRAKYGPTYPNNKRYAIAYFNYYCDAARLLVQGALKGGGLASERVKAGVRLVQAEVQPSFTFRNTLGPDRPFLPGGAMDLRWDTPCGCFTYTGGVHLF